MTMVKTCSRIRRGYFLAPLTRTTMRSGRLTRGSYEDQRGSHSAVAMTASGF